MVRSWIDVFGYQQLLSRMNDYEGNQLKQVTHAYFYVFICFESMYTAKDRLRFWKSWL